MHTTDPYSLRIDSNRRIFREGMRDGFPIGLGYFAVAFSLGIAIKSIGMTPFQGALASMLTNASAGQYAGFNVIGASGTYLEMALLVFIANARYLLMSTALSQRIHEDTRWYHRVIVGFDITDEVFAITIARPGFINPCYTYGVMTTTIPGWAAGTALGCIAGNIMPLRLVSALSVALFGMFLAVIIPPAKQSRVVAGLILVSFAASLGATYLPGISEISSGTRTIILTVVISAAAAILFPKKPEPLDADPAAETATCIEETEAAHES